MKKLLEKYNKIPAEVKLSFWFVVCSVFQKGISFITTPIFTRILSPEDYGTFSIYSSWSGVIGVFATLNLSYGTYNKGILKYKEDKQGYTSSMLGLSTMVTLSIFAVYIIFSKPINNITSLSTQMTLIMFISFIFSPALAMWSTRQRYQSKYKLMLSITVISSILTPIVSIIAINMSEQKALTRIFTSVIISAIVSAYFYMETFVKGRKFFVKEYWTFALKFSVPLIPHYLAGIVLVQSDKIIIEKMVGLDKAGIYSIAYTISMIMSLITSSVNSSFVPWSYKQIEKGEFKKMADLSNKLLVYVLGVTILIMLGSPEIVKLMAPPEYYEAIWVIPPVASSVFFTFFYSLFANIEFYYEKTKFIMVASTIGAALNIVLNIALIPYFGYLVCGYTTLICYMVFVFMHCVFMQKVLKEQKIATFYNFKFFILISIIMLISMLVATSVYNNTILRYGIVIIILAFAIVYARKKFGKVK